MSSTLTPSVLLTAKTANFQPQGAEVFFEGRTFPKPPIIIIFDVESLVKWSLASVEIDIYHPPLLTVRTNA